MSAERPTGWEGADKWFAPGAGARRTPGDAAGPDPVEPAGPAPVEGEGPAPELRCEVCGALLEADQTYCLECGSPTPLAPRLRRGGRNLAMLAGALAILGLGAGALAYAVSEDDDGGGATVVTAASTATVPLVPLPPETGPTTGALPPDTSFTTPTAPGATVPLPGATTGFDTVTGPPVIVTAPPPATTTSDPTTTVAPPPPDPATGASDWPAGTTAWTAILSSVRSELDARAAKSRVAGDGQPAGVLPSSDFAELRPGYWVVFSGRYSERSAAIAQATRLRSTFPGAYARRLSG